MVSQNRNEAGGDASGQTRADSRPQAPIWHRIGTLCKSQDVSLRTLVRRWGLDAGQIRHEQRETSDLRLSQLYRWQKELKVPASELLVNEDDASATSVGHRAQLIKVMKTVMSIQQASQDERVQRLVMNLINQLTLMMPELSQIDPWRGSGILRGLNDLGRAADYRLPEDVIGS